MNGEASGDPLSDEEPIALQCNACGRREKPPGPLLCVPECGGVASPIYRHTESENEWKRRGGSG